MHLCVHLKNGKRELQDELPSWQFLPKTPVPSPKPRN